MTSMHDYLDPTYEPVVPMMPRAQLDRMVDVAIQARQCLNGTSPRPRSRFLVWAGGIATAACFLLVITFTLLHYEPPSDDRDQFDDPSIEISELILADSMEDF